MPSLPSPRYVPVRGSLQARRLLLPSVLSLLASAAAAEPVGPSGLGRLQSLLDATPPGGWAKASLGVLSAAWASPAQGGLPYGSDASPAAVARAWSSFAWDSTRSNLYLWGGGHANYYGNEMYVWEGSSGAWTRGSLPTRIDGDQMTVDNATPQSAHTYDNQLYLPKNDLFVTFGGAAYNSGAGFMVRDAAGNPVPAGPWMFDPLKADANKVGGLDGSGFLPGTAGGGMWTNQQGNWTGGGDGPSHVGTNSAYRSENGRDVVYVTADAYASGWQALFRYELGDVRAGEPGVFQKIGVSTAAPTWQGAATIDSGHQLYIHTSAGAGRQGLGLWDLSVLPSDGRGATVDCTGDYTPQATQCLRDRYISLVDAVAGTPFAVNERQGLAYDEGTGNLYLWDSDEPGTVWETQAKYLPGGSIDPVWNVTRRVSSTAATPFGSGAGYSAGGVLGKWQYAPELGAFVALDNFDVVSQDAAVWLYKPYTSMVAYVDPASGAVPEPGTLGLMLAGLGVLGAGRRGTRR